jgi:SAM-dependent methyltransferase
LDPAEYDYLFELEDTLWWFVGMRRIVYGLLRQNLGAPDRPLKVLDAGCGTGGSLPLLERFGQVTSFDFEARAMEMFASRQRARLAVASTDAIPFADNTFDLVTSFDVICQLDSPADEQALSEMARVLKPGGLLLVRTPALQMLYGSHDRTLHTKHRYSTGEMSRKMQSAGLRVVQATYANTLLFPIALVRRMIAKLTNRPPGESDVRAVPTPLNTALTWVLTAEGEILKRTSLPLGLSVIALARKT